MGIYTRLMMQTKGLLNERKKESILPVLSEESDSNIRLNSGVGQLAQRPAPPITLTLMM